MPRLEKGNDSGSPGSRIVNLIRCTSIIVYLAALPAYSAHADCEADFAEGMKAYEQCRKDWNCTDCCSSALPVPCNKELKTQTQPKDQVDYKPPMTREDKLECEKMCDQCHATEPCRPGRLPHCGECECDGGTCRMSCSCEGIS
jgi:hypothetical protein